MGRLNQVVPTPSYYNEQPQFQPESDPQPQDLYPYESVEDGLDDVHPTPPPYETYDSEDTRQENDQDESSDPSENDPQSQQQPRPPPPPSQRPIQFSPQTQSQNPMYQTQSAKPVPFPPIGSPPQYATEPVSFPSTQSPPQYATAPVPFPPQNPQMVAPPETPSRSYPPRVNPQAFPPPQGNPQAFPPPQGQPQAFPPPQGNPQAIPAPQDQPQSFPPPQGQPQSFPPPQGQPPAFPPPQGQPQAFPPPQGQPQAFTPPQAGLQPPLAVQFPPPANFQLPEQMDGQVGYQAMPPPPLKQNIAQTGIPVTQQLVGTEGWKSGLFGCMEDPGNALTTACFPCVTFGQIAEVIDNGQTSCGTSGMAYGLIACFIGLPCIMSCTYRTKLRNSYRLVESPAPDWATHCCCEWCALCQEYRELHHRGLDPSIGWHGNVTKVQNMPQQQEVAMAPPVNQKMGA